MARQVRAGDVAAVAGLLTDAMRTAPGRDWGVRAGDHEWDVETSRWTPIADPD